MDIDKINSLRLKTVVIKLNRCPIVEELHNALQNMKPNANDSNTSSRMPLQSKTDPNLFSIGDGGDSDNIFNGDQQAQSTKDDGGNRVLETPDVPLTTPNVVVSDKENFNKYKNYVVGDETSVSKKNINQKRKFESNDWTEEGAKSLKIEAVNSFKSPYHVNNTSANYPDLDYTPKRRRSERTRTPVVLGEDFVVDPKYMKSGLATNEGGIKKELLSEDDVNNWPEVKFLKNDKDNPKKAKTKIGSGQQKSRVGKGKVVDKHKDVCQECKKGGFVVCCKSCAWTYHLLCLNPPLTKVPDKGWQCPRCSVEPLEFVARQIMNWRWKENREEREKYEKLSSQEKRLNATPQREYLVNWIDLSYWHCSWVSQTQMKFYHPSLGAAYDRNLEGDSYLLEEEQFPGDEEDPLYQIYFKYGIRPEWLQVQRVISHRKVRGKNQYLVKWRGVPYTQATWEVQDDDQIDNFQKYQDMYQEWKAAFSAAPGKKTLSWFKHINIPPKKPTVDIKIKYEGQPAFVDTDKGLALHNYQIESLNWLRKSWSEGVNTILGDEMGLGKTIQAIVFLYSLYQEGQDTGPFLITAPLSTILNWEREFELWAPDFYVVTYTGQADNRKIIREHEFSFKKGAMRLGKVASKMNGPVKFHVLLTSYEMISKDILCLSSIPWSAVVVDEAHRLKNKSSRFFNELVCYDSKYKLLLTGTPLQNNVEELFNMLTFLGPENVEKYESLGQELENDNISNEGAVKSLQEILKLRMLRRVKEDVLQNLPAKAEYIVKVELSPMQKNFYKYILTKNFEALNSKKGGRYANLQAIIVELQKCCDHPYLFSSAMMEAPTSPNGNFELTALVKASGKLSLLQKMLRALKAGGNRVLIFSHYTRLLNILEDFLEGEGYQYERIDGSITGSLRQDAIDRFNAPGAKQFVFLLSTRAGGLGINLASADTVILYDSDWNPHSDIQALSRAHRIGQKNKVMIYRLITRNSMEERVAQVARRKLMLSHVVLENGSVPFTSPLNRDELENIIRCGTEGLFQEDNDIRDNFTDEAIRDLLDRSRSSFDQKDNLSDSSSSDFFSSVKVVSYTTNKHQESEMGSSSGLTNENQDPDFWERLLGHHCQQKVESPAKPLGKGLRDKKQIEYNEYENSDDDNFLESDDETE